MVEEQNVQPNSNDKTRDGEIEERSVNHQMRDTFFQGVPLVIGGKVDRWGEEREADAREKNYPKSYVGTRSKYLKK
jgi:hypothetical protein